MKDVNLIAAGHSWAIVDISTNNIIKSYSAKNKLGRIRLANYLNKNNLRVINKDSFVIELTKLFKN